MMKMYFRRMLFCMLLLTGSSFSVWAETTITDVLPKGTTTIFNAKYQYGVRGEGDVWASDPSDDGSGKHWYDKEFDDSGWSTKPVPFGSDLSGDQKWEGEYNCYWLRINFNMDAVDNTATYYFLCRHDDTYKAYINGNLIADRPGWTGDGYCYVPLNNSHLSEGTNVIAVYIQQNNGGSYFDCGVKKYNYQQSDFDTRFKGVEVSNGEYYLYNPASGLWLQNNDRIRSDWNTRGQLGTRGLDFTLTLQGNGGYFIKAKFDREATRPSIQAGNRYLDTDAADSWHFEKVNVPGLTNAYKVTYWPTGENDFTLTGSSQSPTASTNLFTPTVSNNIFLDCWRTDINDYSIWVLVSKGQRLAMMMSATNAAPQDATWLIKNADLADNDDRASAWEMTGSFTYNARNNDDNTRFGRVYESYNTENIEFSQTISNLPAGKYRMRVQGFYRSGEAKMFAGSAEQALVSSDTQDDIWTVARNMYYNGAYIGDWMEFTHNGGDLKLGIKKGAKTGDTDWVVFSKFALEYMGTEGMSDLPFSIMAYNGNYRGSGLYSYLFDGDTNTKWECWPSYDGGDYYYFANDNGNVMFAAPNPIYVNGLTLYTGADTQSYPGRNPVDWYLYGTNDVNVAMDMTSGSWNLIEYVNHAQMPATNAEGKYYKFNPSQTAYKYFKFHVHNLVGRDELQLSELVLDYSTTAKAPATVIASGSGHYGSEVAANLFDGPSTTKWCKGNNASTNWVVFKTARPIYASSYIIQTANDADGRDPKTFKLYGALDAAPTTDGSTEGWTEIDSEDDASGTIPTDRYAFADFTIDNPGIYQYFMFKVEANRSNDGSFQMSELIIDNDENKLLYISSDADMAEFASKVNNGSTSLNALLLEDVNSSTSAGTTDNKYVGTFDGQGHVVTLNISTSTEYQGLIGCATGGAVIQNVITRGSVSGSARCGGILGGSQGSGAISITNCGNEANITTTGVNAGGVHGCNNGSGVVYTLTNCYNTGTIYGGSESAGLSGWLGNDATVINCYNSGSVTGIDNSNRSFARWNSGTYENCYNTLPAGTFSGRTDDYPMSKVTSGELCYRLNGDTNDGTTWTQTIGTDGHPIPFSTRQAVHQANTNCFTNLPVSDHVVVQINNADDLVKFSAEVNNGNISMDAEVVADIDMTDKSDWWPIGGTDASDNGNDAAKAYKGTFDGKNHTIDNLVQDANGNNNQGLFGVVNGGCVIKNLILGSGCHFKGAKFVGALVGSSRGSGWVTIQNCGNEGTVTASGNNAAAIIGCVINGGPATRITDCYNRGNVSGNAESAILTGWFGGHSSVEVNNFYNTGTISGHDGGHLYRNNANILFNNVYHTSANQNATQIGEGWLTSGELCYKLGASFKQDLSQESYPIPFGTKAVSAGKWFNDATDDVYYNFKDGNYTVYQLNLSDQISKYSVPENVTAKNVSISRTIPEGQWIGLCLPFDYDIPSGWEVRELQSVNGSGESARMLFSTATSIVAGKPYIVKPTSEVETIVATDKAITTAAGTIVEGDITMIGNFASETLTPGTYYINKSSQLMKLGDGYTANLKGFRAYFTVDGASGVKALGFDFEDNATDLNNLNGLSDLNDVIYNLAGQRLNKSQKGINIINGKKVLK